MSENQHKNWNQTLCDASYNGKLSEVKEALSKGANVNWKHPVKKKLSLFFFFEKILSLTLSFFCRVI